MSMDRVDRLLEQIDAFDVDEHIDQQLARGDQSNTFRGERTRKCRWCREDWHGLPITKKMVEMRLNPYGWDEFGQPVMDPNYKYSEDTSDWVCPGSEFHGPETPNKSWRLPRGQASFQTEHIDAWRLARARVDPSRYRIWRFLPPFDGWTVNLETRYYEHPSRDPGLQRIVNLASFAFDELIPVPPEVGLPGSRHPWWFGIGNVNYSHNDGMRAHPLPYSFNYEDVRMHYRDPRQRYAGADPDWVEFITDANLHTFAWCGQHWQSRALTAEEESLTFPNTQVQSETIIDTFVDEAYSIPNEELDDAIRGATLRAAAAAEAEAARQQEREPQILSFSNAVPPSDEDEVED